MKASKFGILSAILAASCCVGPLLLAVLGISAGSVFFGRFHWFFLAAGGIVLVYAWWRFMNEKSYCECESYKDSQTALTSPTQKRTLLFLIGATAIFLLFLGMSLFQSFGGQSLASASLQNVVLKPGEVEMRIPIKGMSCVTCEIVIKDHLKKVSGVQWVKVSAAANEAIVVYDRNKTKVEELLSAIKDSGYEPGDPQLISSIK
ncbi:hypothetical protein A946_10720 [Methylacidiphilum kamchatkense Kam1]|uniref:Mercuric transport protein MerT n=1 Tax=Methylacidiphilum kamchatkense Kam1 TaxID=1202785 RepID=A0A0C1UPZ3_9BACT|nr:mercuric transporter MerT family protein [Methylacidiphilum kamchatkense]KIE57908.1 hypothetical protein A946_10720 [Methylacidiphilum kamchatkense Kam1]QDQ41412.1 copper chaperone CopZ [Methylacidiphilum kamchatkense Kam1]